MTAATVEDPVELTLAHLRRATRDCQFKVTADDRISEHNAARLLQVHSDTLARWRAEGSGPTPYGIGVGRAKVSYRLLDLALYIELHREKIDGNPTEPVPTPLKGLNVGANTTHYLTRSSRARGTP